MKLLRLQQAEAAGEQEVRVVLDEDIDPVYTPWN